MVLKDQCAVKLVQHHRLLSEDSASFFRGEVEPREMVIYVSFPQYALSRIFVVGSVRRHLGCEADS